MKFIDTNVFVYVADSKNPAKRAAVSVMRNTQSRGALPPKKRSVAQPANSMPPIPANSNSMITVPVSLGSNPFASCSIVGPQSAISALTALIVKLQRPSIQMTGLRNTMRSTELRVASCEL